MKVLLALLLIFGMSYAAMLMTFDVEIENTCDEETEVTRVTVTSGSSNPVENAYVKVEDIDPWKQKTSGIVDSDGVFEFEGCGDTWNVTVSYGGYETTIETVELGSCGSCVAVPEPEPEENETEADPPPVEPPEEETTTPPVVDPPEVTKPTTPPVPELYETDDEEPEEETINEKKPLPCCASTTILLGLVGLFAIRLKA